MSIYLIRSTISQSNSSAIVPIPDIIHFYNCGSVGNRTHGSLLVVKHADHSTDEAVILISMFLKHKSIHEEIKCRFKAENSRYLVQHFECVILISECEVFNSNVFQC